jgi:Ca2+-binding RTX toxin-like protein
VRPNGTKIEYFTGGPGNDTIDGGNGQDRASYSNSPNPVVVDLQAGTAFDGYDSDPGAPGVQPYTDTLISVERALGSGWNDALLGSDRTDTSEMFDGMAGNDAIDGRGGFDYVSFQSGTNGAVVNLSTGEATNDGWGDADTLAGIEGVIGSRLDDSITGGAGNESFDGSFGNDTINGGAGTDRALYENASSAVTVNLATGVASDGLGGADTLSNIEEVLGSIFNDSLTGKAAANRLDGGAGDDSMVGGGGNDTYVVDAAGDAVTELAGGGTDVVNSSITYTLGAEVEHLTLTGLGVINGTGNGLNNRLIGNNAANILNGGTGNDSMFGWEGDDIYIVDSAGDVVAEGVPAGGIDTVQSFVSFSLATIGNIEHLTLMGAAAIDGTGNNLGNTMTGNVAANVLGGGFGNDVLAGGGGNDTLNGGAGDDTLNGGVGDDAMAGGANNDVYFVNSTLDAVSELAGEGVDLINSSVTYTLSAEVENLTLTGLGVINGTGNGLANRLIGNNVANVLNGGTGNDSMFGAEGDDIYIVDSAGDMVAEGVPAGGIDTVQSFVSFSLAAIGNIEHLTLMGAAAIDGIGNNLGNTMIGNVAANALSGSFGNDILAGGGGNDTLAGGAGNDTLNGGAGDDAMAGGANNDIYFVNSALDAVSELAGEGGADQVNSTITHTLSDQVEKLVLSGAAAIDGTGNGLANTLVGNGADNVLDGAGGADVMAGGAGNDTYIVDHAADRADEASAAGTDSVLASASFTLRPNVENLTLTGGANINGAGNTLNNVLTGNGGINLLNGLAGADTLAGGAGNDVLRGGTGNDQLTGDAGIDRFEFFEAPGAANADLITDFTSAVDKLRLDDAFFAGIGALGNFAPNDARFFAGAGATGGADASDRVIYDTTSGQLYYDLDGSGAAGAELIATLQDHPSLAATDFMVI